MKVILIFAAMLLSLAPAIGLSEETIVVRDPWIRAAPPNAPVLAGYMTLENRSRTAKTLVRAISGAFGAVTIHRTEEVHGVAHMTPLAKVDLAPHAAVVFRPGGYHLMLAQAKRTLVAGDQVAIDLEYADGTRASALFVVRNDMRAEQSHHH